MALYAGAGELAREMGVKEIVARPYRHGDYSYEAGYRRVRGAWRLDMLRSPYRRDGLPADGWRRVLALWGVLAIPFFNFSMRN